MWTFIEFKGSLNNKAFVSTCILHQGENKKDYVTRSEVLALAISHV